MWEGTAVAAVHSSEIAARIDVARLEAAGIRARVAADNCGGMRPHFDLDLGVRVLVAESDLESARALLVAAPADPAPWQCGTCGSRGEPGFDACWNCGAPRA